MDKGENCSYGGGDTEDDTTPVPNKNFDSIQIFGTNYFTPLCQLVRSDTHQGNQVDFVKWKGVEK